MKTQVLFLRGEESNTGRDVEHILVDDSLLFFLLSLFPFPSTGSWTDPSLSCSCRAAWQSGCLSYVFAWACPSALVSAVIVHGGRDAGDYRGASSCCKVTCNSWTYKWQEEGDKSVKLWSGGKTGLLMMLYTRNMEE